MNNLFLGLALSIHAEELITIDPIALARSYWSISIFRPDGRFGPLLGVLIFCVRFLHNEWALFGIMNFSSKGDLDPSVR